MNILSTKINNSKLITSHTTKIGKSGWKSKSLKNGKERKISIFYSLTGPPKGIQEWQVEEES